MFQSLALSGTGYKILKTDIEITGVLSLGNKELKAESFKVHVTNPNSGAVIRAEDATTTGTGFISTDAKGALIRKTSSDQDYLFPLGSAQPNLGLTGVNILYRPVLFKPESSFENTFSASLINADPGLDGFDKTKKRYDVKTVSDKYYYILGQKTGT